MKKLLWLVVLFVCSVPYASAQQGLQAYVVTGTGAQARIVLTGSAIVLHQLTWNVTGTVSSCTVALDTSVDGVSWSAGNAIAGQTCTSNGQSALSASAVFNFVRVNTTVFSGTGSVVVSWAGYVASPGGLPSGCTSPGTGAITCTGTVSAGSFVPPGGSAFPVTVTGGVSGGTPCFTSTTVEAASAAFPVSNILIGGGVGACVSSEAFVPIAQVGSAGLSGTAPLAIASTGVISCPTCIVTGVVPVSSTTAVTSTNPTINIDQQLIELTLAAGYFNTLKQPYLFQGSGTYNTTAAATPVLTFKIKICTVSGCGSGTIVTLINIVTTAVNTTLNTGLTWSLQTTGITNATGVTGNIVAKGNGLTIDLGAAVASADTVFTDTNTATSANIDLTAALFVDFTVAQSVAGATNAYTQLMGTVGTLTGSVAPTVTVVGLNNAQPSVLDTTALTGADFGARLNTCNSQLGASGGICNGLNENSSPTLTTAATISNPVIVWMPCRQTVQTTTITFSGTGSSMKGCEDMSSKMLNNATNTDMISLSGTDNSITYMRIDHNDTGNSWTGCDINLNSATRPTLDHDFISTWKTGAICAVAPAAVKVTNVDYLDSGFATGPLFSASGGYGTFYNFNGNDIGPHNQFTLTGGTWLITNSSIQGGGVGQIGISSVAPTTLTLIGDQIAGEASGFPALNSVGATLTADNNSFGCNASTVNCIELGASVQQTFTNNLVSWNPGSNAGVAGIHVKGDTIGENVSFNKIIVNAGETPSGNVYALWLDTSAGGHFLQGNYVGNFMRGASFAFDNGAFFDNSTGNSTAGGNIISFNSCVDINGTCLVRNAGGATARTTYIANTTNAGVLYSTAGDLTDVIVDQNIAFAQLPNAGGGTIIYSQDTNGNGASITGSGSGALLGRINGFWQTAVGGNLNVSSTVSGADYTNSTVTPSTVFTFTLPATTAAKNYKYSCEGLWESTAATLVGPVFGLNLSAAPTQLTGNAQVVTALAGTYTTGYLSNTTTGSQTLITSAVAGVTSTNYPFKIFGTIEGAAVAGSTFTINAAATSGSTATLNIRRGAGCILN